MRLLYSVLVLALLWGARLFSGEPPAESEEERVSSVFLEEDETVKALLQRAARFAEERDWKHSLDCYAEVLRRFPNAVYPAGDSLFKGVTERVSNELLKLPPEALAIYRVIHDAPARELYEAALHTLQAAPLEKLIREYLATSYGDSALCLLGELYYERGHFRTARAYWERLLAYPGSVRDARGVLARLALTSARAGEARSADNFLASLEVLPGAGGTISISGAEISLAGYLREELRRQSAPVRPPGEDELWTTYGGDSSHTRLPSRAVNPGVKKWEFAIPGAGAPAQQDLWGRPRQASPSCYPTSGGGTLYLATPNAIYALYAPTGRLRWKYEEPGASPGEGLGWPRNRYHFATLSDDGTRVFALLESPPAAFGEQALQRRAASLSPNKLLSFDAGSGKLLWKVQESPRELEGLYFTSAPITCGGRLFLGAVAAASSGDSYLVALEARTGKFLWKNFICSGLSRGTGHWMAASPSQADLALVPATSEDTVLHVTNLGAIASFQASTGSLRWIRLYPSRSTGQQGFDRAAAQKAGAWQTNPPLVAEGVLYAAPQDSDFLFALDVASGRELFRVPREENNYLLGLSRDKLLLSGKRVLALSSTTGKRLWVSDLLVGEPRGRGIVTAESVWLPTANALYELELASGKMASSYRWKDGSREPGNVLIAGRLLVTASVSHLNGYYVWEEILASLHSKIARDPSASASYFEMGEIHVQRELWSDAVGYFEKALQLARAGETYQGLEILPEACHRLHLAHYDWAAKLQREAKNAAALEHYRTALSYSPDAASSLRCYLRFAELHERAESFTELAADYQLILRNARDEEYRDGAGRTMKASFHAELKLRELLAARGREPYAAFDHAAAKLFQRAQAEHTEAPLVEILQCYPHSLVLPEALLVLAERKRSSSDFKNEAQYLREFLRRFPEDQRAPQALFGLAESYDKLQRKEIAASILRKLLRKFPQAELELGGGRRASAQALVQERLKGEVPAAAAKPLPRLSLPLKLRWEARNAGNPTAVQRLNLCENSLVMTLAPVERSPESLSTLFTMRDGRRIEARRGSDGELLWARELQARQAIFAGDTLLALSGNMEEVLALELRTGKEKWRRVAAGQEKHPMRPAMSMPQRWQVMAADSARALVASNGGTLLLLDLETGQELWSVELQGMFYGLPFITEELVIAATRNPFRVRAFDLETGRLCYEIPFQEVANHFLLATAEVLLMPQPGGLAGHDLESGKLLWKEQLGGRRVLGMLSEESLVLAVTCEPNRLVALDPRTGQVHWQAELPGRPQMGTAIHSDGKQVVLAMHGSGEVLAYDRETGSLTWRSPAGARVGQDVLQFTEKHVLVNSESWDGGKYMNIISLLERTSGKLCWKKESRNRYCQAALLEDALCILEPGVISCLAPAQGEEEKVEQRELNELRERQKNNSGDVRLRLELARALRLREEAEPEAAELLSALFENRELRQKLSPEEFGEAWKLFEELRLQAAESLHPRISLPRVAPGEIKVDGALADWKGIKPLELAGARYLWLSRNDKAGEQDLPSPLDLSAQLYAAYSERELYFALSVSDDIHRNDQEGHSIWDGDSVQFALDPLANGGMAYREDDCELGLALARGQVVSFQWVERGNNTSATPQGLYQVQRLESSKKTIYEAAIPFTHLGALVPEKGRNFGFTLVVNDCDEPERAQGDLRSGRVEAGLALTPGIWNPKAPGRYARGVLE